MTGKPTTVPADGRRLAPAGCQLLRVSDVAGLLKIHTGTIWRKAALAEAGYGDFPKPLRLGPKTIRWRMTDVEQYIAALAGEGGL
jgi:predicted DNA-binding transcriptional regulator AlpA